MSRNSLGRSKNLVSRHIEDRVRLRKGEGSRIGKERGMGYPFRPVQSGGQSTSSRHMKGRKGQVRTASSKRNMGTTLQCGALTQSIVRAAIQKEAAIETRGLPCDFPFTRATPKAVNRLTVCSVLGGYRVHLGSHSACTPAVGLMLSQKENSIALAGNLHNKTARLLEGASGIRLYILIAKPRSTLLSEPASNIYR